MLSSATRDGLTISYQVTGDPKLVFVHANGFCKEIWQPVVAALGDPDHISIDQPGHGGSDAPPPPFDWWDFGKNVLAVIDAAGATGQIGVGHSSGAATLAMAEILRPGTFSRLVLIEPIISPPPYGRIDDHPLITGALKRRTTFPTPESAHRAYRGRGPFARWDDQALQAYVRHGFGPTPSGQWTLRCVPEVEAEVYSTSRTHGAWDRLGEILCPVDLVAGEHSDSHPEEFVRRQAAQLPDVEVHIVPDTAHFVPMEDPVGVAAIVRGR